MLWRRKQFCCATLNPACTALSFLPGPDGKIAPEHAVLTAKVKMDHTPGLRFLGMGKNLEKPG